MKTRFLIAAVVLWALPAWAQNYRTGQGDCTGTASVVGSQTNRASLVFRNFHATEILYIGKSTVTTTTGHAVPPGTDFPIGTTVNGNAVAMQLVYCISDGTTVPYTYWESTR